VKGSTPSSYTLEAEKAILYGAKAERNHPDYSGTGFADFKNAYNDYVQWSLNSTQNCSSLLQFRYSNGREYDRPLQLEVNGAVVASILPFPSTGSWKNWSMTEAVVNLNAGINTIRLTAIGSSGPNIDYLAINCDGTVTAGRPVLEKTAILPTSGAFTAYVTPNPASANAKLVLSGASRLPVEMELLDIAGKSYQKRNFTYSGSNSIDFSVNGLQSGVYIVKVRQGNNVTSTKLIIKN